LPFVRHPEHPWFFEERWLFEGINDCYLPLLEMLDGLARDRVHTRLSMSLTPTLVAGLDDAYLRDRFLRHHDDQLMLAEKEVDRTRGTALEALARFYRDRFTRHRLLYDGYGGDLAGAFARHQDEGRLEILASAATHAYLPLAGVKAAWAQVVTGVDAYRRRFGRSPSGFWLPECGFAPGLDALLAAAGARYTVMETHGVTHAVPRPRYGALAPIRTPSGVAVFPRDPESSKQVWSADEGYPGDPYYREFYRDIGYDLDYEYLRPHLGPPGERLFTGIKYHRVTARTSDDKELYDPAIARERARIHAENFAFNRAKQVEWYAGGMDRPPLVVCPYDAELFGHWWFEGPWWLDQVVRTLAHHPVLEAITPTDYLQRYPRLQPCRPSLSSWGYKGYSEVWLEGANDWTYRHLQRAGVRMDELAGRFAGHGGLEARAVRQAMRELLLAQASDWAFMMKTGTFPGYARRRFKGHIAAFTELYHALTRGRLDEARLAELEARHPLFPAADPQCYTQVPELSGVAGS
jgi:1,4-alpha-glucan branching enzyme